MARPEGRKKILHAGGDFHARSRVSLSSLSKRKKIAEVIGAHMVNNRFTKKREWKRAQASDEAEGRMGRNNRPFYLVCFVFPFQTM